jgi:hypothetical protein
MNERLLFCYAMIDDILCLVYRIILTALWIVFTTGKSVSYEENAVRATVFCDFVRCISFHQQRHITWSDEEVMKAKHGLHQAQGFRFWYAVKYCKITLKKTSSNHAQWARLGHNVQQVRCTESSADLPSLLRFKQLSVIYVDSSDIAHESKFAWWTDDIYTSAVSASWHINKIRLAAWTIYYTVCMLNVALKIRAQAAPPPSIDMAARSFTKTCS